MGKKKAGRVRTYPGTQIVRLGGYGDEVLRTKANLVPTGDQLLGLIHKLYIIMKRDGGVGLAAPQIGISARVAVVETVKEKVRILVDPALLNPEGQEIAEEGCLSIPHVALPIARAMKIYVVSKGGGDPSYEATGLEARVIQHEVDHLNGILITDRGYETIQLLREVLSKAASTMTDQEVAARIKTLVNLREEANEEAQKVPS